VVDPTAEVGAFVYIGERVHIGARVVLYPGTWIDADSKIGADSVLYGGVKVYAQSEIGARCILHAGAVIGSDGFGYVQENGKQIKVPQLGRAILHDDVEIGANTTVDRGAIGDTVIGEGTKIDNLVQVGHNCILGKNNIICSMVGLSGTTTVGDNSLLAGMVGTKGHVKIGSRVQVAGQTGVSKDIADDQAVKGYPPMPLREYLKVQTLFTRLPEIYKRLQQVEKLLRPTGQGESRD
jgi:UDP-3-O-[3-hydroxymyristoyl] glucosamine N-acyltransferase